MPHPAFSAHVPLWVHPELASRLINSPDTNPYVMSHEEYQSPDSIAAILDPKARTTTMAQSQISNAIQSTEPALPNPEPTALPGTQNIVPVATPPQQFATTNSPQFQGGATTPQPAGPQVTTGPQNVGGQGYIPYFGTFGFNPVQGEQWMGGGFAGVDPQTGHPVYNPNGYIPNNNQGSGDITAGIASSDAASMSRMESGKNT